MSMFYCAAHNEMEDSDFVGIVATDELNGTWIETCDNLSDDELARYHPHSFPIATASTPSNEPLPYTLPALYALRKGLQDGSIPVDSSRLYNVAHKILVLEDNPNHYE